MRAQPVVIYGQSDVTLAVVFRVGDFKNLELAEQSLRANLLEYSNNGVHLTVFRRSVPRAASVLSLDNFLAVIERGLPGEVIEGVLPVIEVPYAG